MTELVEPSVWLSDPRNILRHVSCPDCGAAAGKRCKELPVWSHSRVLGPRELHDGRRSLARELIAQLRRRQAQAQPRRATVSSQTRAARESDRRALLNGGTPSTTNHEETTMTPAQLRDATLALEDTGIPVDATPEIAWAIYERGEKHGASVDFTRSEVVMAQRFRQHLERTGHGNLAV